MSKYKLGNEYLIKQYYLPSVRVLRNEIFYIRSLEASYKDSYRFISLFFSIYLDKSKLFINIISGEKPYKCEFCPNAYAQNGDLNKHKRSHIGENTYKCTEAGCVEAFRLQAELRDHMKVHYCKD